MVLNNCNKYYILYKNQDRKKAEFQRIFYLNVITMYTKLDKHIKIAVKS